MTNHDRPARLHHATTWLLALLLALAALLLHVRYLTRLDHDGANSGAEGGPLAALTQVANDQPLYRDFHQPPHLITQYMPLFYLVPGTLARWTNAHGPTIFLIGRCYVYACWLGAGWLLYLLARQAGAARLPATLAAFFWLAIELAGFQAVSFRPDGTQLFFTLAAVWIYFRAPRSLNLTGAVALLVVAFFHKQAAAVPLLVIFIEECRQRRFSRAVALASGWTVAVAGSICLTQTLTGGLFLMNTFQSLAAWADPRRVLLIITLALTPALPVWAGGALCCVTTADQTSRFWRWYFVLALGFAFASSWKFGSAPNYYLEPLAAGCVLTALWLTNQATQRPRLWLGWLAVALVVTMESLWLRAGKFADWSPALLGHGAVREQEARDWEQLLRCIGPLTDPVLIEDDYLAARRGGNTLMVDATYFGALQPGGHFNDTGILRDIAAGRFTAILATAPIEDDRRFRHFTATWRTAISQHYRLARVCEQGRTVIYLYEPGPGQRTTPAPATRPAAGNSPAP